MTTRLFILLATLLLCPLIADALDPQSPIQIETANLSIRLASPDQGMGIVSLVHKQLRQEFIKPSDTPLLWKLELTTAFNDDDAFYALSNRNKTGTRRAFIENGRYILEWFALDLKEGKGLMDVRVTINPKGAHGLAEWRLDVRNRGKQTGIYRPVFPVVECGVIGDSGADDYLLATAAEGRSVRNPVFSGRTSVEYWTLGMDGQPSTTAVGDTLRFAPQRPHGIPYPTARGQMQFAAYYQKPGNFYYPTRSLAGGLYLATYDGAPHPKVFFLSPEKKRKCLTLEIAHYPESQAEKDAGYTMPYPVIFDGFDGDWYDAATLYRAWAIRQTWTKSGPLHQRNDVADWVKRATAVLRIDARQRPNEQAIEIAGAVRRALPGPMIAQWYNWAAPEKLNAGCAYPPVAEVPPGFAEILQQLKTMDIHVFPYVNCRLWASARDGYAAATKYAARDRHGDLHHLGVVAEDHTPNAAYMCDMTSFWQDYLFNVCRQMKSKYGVEALYLDQLTGAHYSGALMRKGSPGESGGCWNRAHGHPLGMNRFFIKAQLNNVRRIVNALSENGKQFALCGEGTDETLVGLTPVKLIHYELWPGYVPIFGRVYHDYITYYGRTVSLAEPEPKGDPYVPMNIAWQLVCGNQFGRIWSISESALKKSPAMRKNLAYLKQAVEARRQFPQYLCLGELLRPPYLSAVPDITTKAARKGGNISLPSVLAGTFRAPNGRVAIVLTSVNDHPLTFTVSVDSADAVELVRVFPAEKPLGRLSRNGELALSLQPREIAVIELRP